MKRINISSLKSVKARAIVTCIASFFLVADAAADTITLQISHSFAGRSEFIERMKSRFNETHKDIKIEYLLAGDNWEPLFQSTIRGAMIKQLPDLTHQSINYTRILVERKIVQPIDKIPGGREFLDTAGVSDALLRAASVDGHAYNVPYGLTVPVVFYNMSLLKKAGWGADRAPKTWSEINDAAVKVAALGGNTNGGFFEFEASNNWMYQNVLTGVGGAMQRDDGSIGFDGKDGIEAMSIIADFARSANTVAMTRDQAREAFNAGTMGVLFRSASGILSAEKAAKANGFTLAIGAFPITKKGRISANSHGIYVLTEDPARQRAALEYLKWAYGPEGQSIEADYSGYFPANFEIFKFDNEVFKNYFAKNAYARNIIDSLAGVQDWYTYPVAHADQIFKAQIEIVRRVIIGQIKPVDAVAEMSSETKRLLN